MSRASLSRSSRAVPQAAAVAVEVGIGAAVGKGMPGAVEGQKLCLGHVSLQQLGPIVGWTVSSVPHAAKTGIPECPSAWKASGRHGKS